jgi:hypothetical protein
LRCPSSVSRQRAGGPRQPRRDEPAILPATLMFPRIIARIGQHSCLPGLPSPFPVIGPSPTPIYPFWKDLCRRTIHRYYVTVTKIGGYRSISEVEALHRAWVVEEAGAVPRVRFGQMERPRAYDTRPGRIDYWVGSIFPELLEVRDRCTVRRRHRRQHKRRRNESVHVTSIPAKTAPSSSCSLH